jgi:hypothetical protein
MQSDRGFLLGFLMICVFACASAFIRACGEREIFAAQRAYSERTGKQPPTDLVGCERCHIETQATHWMLNRVSMHRDTCTTCHRGDASAITFAGANHGATFASDGTRKILSGTGALAKCNSCHASLVEEQSEVAEGARLYEARRCDACHHAPLVDSALRYGRRPLDGRKLTREFIYRYLLDPSAFDTTQPAGPHHLSAESQLRLSAKAQWLAQAITKGAPKHPAPASKGAQPPKVLAQCEACHTADLKTLGTKTHHEWIAEFLRHPREVSGFTLHPDLMLSGPDLDALTKHLALARHKTFEPKWPEPTRALDAELEKLQGDPLVSEGCTACHSSTPVTRRLHRAIDDETKRVLRSGHHGAYLAGKELDSVVAFIDATRAAWPQREHVVTGEDVWTSARCEQCHTRPFVSNLLGFAEALGGPPHDYGFSEDGRYALLVDYLEKNELLSRPDPVPNREAAARGEKLCAELQCKKCFPDAARLSRWSAIGIDDKLRHCSLKRPLKDDERRAMGSYLRLLSAK